MQALEISFLIVYIIICYDAIYEMYTLSLSCVCLGRWSSDMLAVVVIACASTVLVICANSS